MDEGEVVALRQLLETLEKGLFKLERTSSLQDAEEYDRLHASLLKLHQQVEGKLL